MEDVAYPLAPGEVLIWFDLNVAMVDKTSLDAQLRVASRRLKSRLKTYASSLGKEPVGHKPQAEQFTKYLDLLDMLEDKFSVARCAKEVFPDKAKVRDPVDLVTLVKDPIASAKRLAESGYVFLASKEGKPEWQSIARSKTRRTNKRSS